MSPLVGRDHSNGADLSLLSRRRLLLGIASGGGLLAMQSLLAACAGPSAAPAGAPTTGAAPPSGAAQAGPRGFGNVGTLKLLMSSHFVPAYDTWFDQWAKDWGTKNGIEIQVDHIVSAQLAAKNAAEVAAQSGHDLYKLTRNGEGPLYHDVLVDVGDLTKQIGEAHGGWVPFGETIGLYQ